MLKFITRSVLLLLCAGTLSSCTAVSDTIQSIIMLPFNIVNSVI